MILKNSFTSETRELFMWNYECWICQMNNWDAAHHILGRISNSPLNFCPLHNTDCHIGNGTLSTFDVQKKMLAKTYQFLMSSGYILTDYDKIFISKNKKYYKNII